MILSKIIFYHKKAQAVTCLRGKNYYYSYLSCVIISIHCIVYKYLDKTIWYFPLFFSDGQEKYQVLLKQSETVNTSNN